jgi:hypothetical protein
MVTDPIVARGRPTYDRNGFLVPAKYWSRTGSYWQQSLQQFGMVGGLEAAHVSRLCWPVRLIEQAVARGSDHHAKPRPAAGFEPGRCLRPALGPTSPQFSSHSPLPQTCRSDLAGVSGLSVLKRFPRCRPTNDAAAFAIGLFVLAGGSLSASPTLAWRACWPPRPADPRRVYQSSLVARRSRRQSGTRIACGRWPCWVLLRRRLRLVGQLTLRQSAWYWRHPAGSRHCPIGQKQAGQSTWFVRRRGAPLVPNQAAEHHRNPGSSRIRALRGRSLPCYGLRDAKTDHARPRRAPARRASCAKAD